MVSFKCQLFSKRESSIEGLKIYFLLKSTDSLFFLYFFLQAKSSLMRQKYTPKEGWWGCSRDEQPEIMASLKFRDKCRVACALLASF